jgi:hypothetical protein
VRGPGKTFRCLGLLGVLTAAVIAGAPAAASPKPKAVPNIIVRASPNPVVETGPSDAVIVVQVEANPMAANKSVTISSSQLTGRCGSWRSWLFNSPGLLRSVTVPIDNDGNATIVIFGQGCAPGSALIDASLNAPPFGTAVTKVVLEPPQRTPAGVRAFPNPEVEVGDNAGLPAPSNTASESDFAFVVETAPAFAEQSVNLTSNQLGVRCGAGFRLESTNGTGGLFPPGTGASVSNTIDNDGNAAFFFLGASCAAGKSTVIAEVLGGGATYSGQVTILPPSVTV